MCNEGVCDDATGPWARKVLSPVTNKCGPMWKNLERKVQARVDSLPPGVSSFLDLKTSESFSTQQVFAAMCFSSLLDLRTSGSSAAWQIL